MVAGTFLKEVFVALKDLVMFRRAANVELKGSWLIAYKEQLCVIPKVQLMTNETRYTSSRTTAWTQYIRPTGSAFKGTS